LEILRYFKSLNYNMFNNYFLLVIINFILKNNLSDTKNMYFINDKPTLTWYYSPKISTLLVAKRCTLLLA
jgi:hypothetical protein